MFPRFFAKISILFLLLEMAKGLQCHSCMYEKLHSETNGSFLIRGEESCKNVDETDGKQELVSCDDDSNIINRKDLKGYLKRKEVTFHCIQVFYQEKSPPLELVVRGCFARQVKKPKYPDPEEEEEEEDKTKPPPLEEECGLAFSNFYDSLRKGELTLGNSELLNFTHPEVKACVCNTGDGCNSKRFVSSASREKVRVGLLILGVFLWFKLSV